MSKKLKDKAKGSSHKDLLERRVADKAERQRLIRLDRLKGRIDVHKGRA